MTDRLSDDETRGRLVDALPELSDVVWLPSTDRACRDLPSWVRAHGDARTEDAWWVLLEAAAGGLGGMAQAVLDVAPGRYLVEVYDAARGAWISRESALAPPLVVGVPRRRGAVILRITLNQDPSTSP